MSEDIDLDKAADMDLYRYRIEIAESVECSCGSTHEKGDAVWGGVNEPNARQVGIVNDLHDGEKIVVDADE